MHLQDLRLRSGTAEKKLFIQQYQDFLNAMMANPIVLLKSSSAQAIQPDELLEDMCLPSWEETKERIPFEFERRQDVRRKLEAEINSIPSSDSSSKEAVERCQA